MKKFGLMIFVLSISLLIAQGSYASNIATVDLNRVMQDSNAGKSAKASIERLVEAKKVVINRKIKEISKLSDMLKSGKLSAKERDRQRDLYQEKVKALQRYKTDAADEVRAKEREMSNNIISSVVDIIKKYAKAHKIDAVMEIHNGGLIYWNDANDITKKIVSIYNKEYAKSGK